MPMTERLARSLKVVALVVALWLPFLMPGHGPAWLWPVGPTITAVAFALLSWYLRIGSWLLTIVFSLTFFLYAVAIAYASSLAPGSELAGAPPGLRAGMIYFSAVLFSPISLWGPVLFGSLAYAWASRSNIRLER
jgi:hypothetical protein